MALTITVTVEGHKEAIRKFNRLAKEVQREVHRATRVTALAVERGAKRRAPVDTGRLRSSLRSQYFDGGARAEVGTNTGYGAFVEYGTGPMGQRTKKGPMPKGYHHGGPFFPPPSALEHWVRRVIKPKPENLKTVAFLVAQKIYRRGGTRARPFLYPAWIEQRPKYVERIDDAVNKAVRKSKK